MSLADTDAESLLSQLDASSYGVDDGVRTPSIFSDLLQADTTNPAAPQSISYIRISNSNVSGLTVSHGSQNSGGW